MQPAKAAACSYTWFLPQGATPWTTSRLRNRRPQRYCRSRRGPSRTGFQTVPCRPPMPSGDGCIGTHGFFMPGWTPGSGPPARRMAMLPGQESAAGPETTLLYRYTNTGGCPRSHRSFSGMSLVSPVQHLHNLADARDLRITSAPDLRELLRQSRRVHSPLPAMVTLPRSLGCQTSTSGSFRSLYARRSRGDRRALSRRYPSLP